MGSHRTWTSLALALGLAVVTTGCGLLGGGGGRRVPRAGPSGGGERAFVDVLVPEPARGELGLSGAALSGTEFLDPASSPGLVDRIRALVQPARRCVEPPAAAWITFRIWADGHVSLQRVATLAAPKPDAVQRCVEAVVAGWTFPEPPASRGIVLLQVFSERPPPSQGVLPVDPELELPPGAGPPEPFEPGCVAEAMRRAPGAAVFARDGAQTTAMFAVDRSGAASRFHVLEPTPIPVAAAVRSAVEGCRWRPAVVDGRPVAVWRIQAVKFAAAPGE